MTDVKPSKSARKREFLALQKLGEELLTLRDCDLAEIELDEDLRHALLDARRMRSRGALRRQVKYIGKLMRRTDPEPIRAALARMRR